MTPAIPHMSGQDVQVLLALPVRDGGEELLPLVTLVVHVDIVEAAGHRAAHDLVCLQRLERLAQERRLGQVRVAGGVDGAELEAAPARDPDERRAVLPAVVLVDRRPEAEVPESLVRVDGRGGDAAEAAIVVEDAANELEAD